MKYSILMLPVYREQCFVPGHDEVLREELSVSHVYKEFSHTLDHVINIKTMELLLA